MICRRAHRLNERVGLKERGAWIGIVDKEMGEEASPWILNIRFRESNSPRGAQGCAG